MERDDKCRDLFKVTFIVGTFYMFNCLINELKQFIKQNKKDGNGKILA